MTPSLARGTEANYVAHAVLSPRRRDHEVPARGNLRRGVTPQPGEKEQGQLLGTVIGCRPRGGLSCDRDMSKRQLPDSVSATTSSSSPKLIMA